MVRTIYFSLFFFIRYPLNLIKRNSIHYSTRISTNVNIARSRIGKFCYIASNVNIVGARIGNYVSIAPGVQIGGMEHSYWWYSTSTFLSDYCISNRQTIIEDDVWIAAGAIIKQGVKIGRGSVVGAMSFVNKDVPENSIVIGIPAKFKKHRFDMETFSKLGDSLFWTYSPRRAREILSKL